MTRQGPYPPTPVPIRSSQNGMTSELPAPFHVKHFAYAINSMHVSDDPQSPQRSTWNAGVDHGWRMATLGRLLRFFVSTRTKRLFTTRPAGVLHPSVLCCLSTIRRAHLPCSLADRLSAECEVRVRQIQRQAHYGNRFFQCPEDSLNHQSAVFNSIPILVKVKSREPERPSVIRAFPCPGDRVFGVSNASLKQWRMWPS